MIILKIIMNVRENRNNKRKNNNDNNNPVPPKKLKTDEDIMKIIMTNGSDSDSTDGGDKNDGGEKCVNPLCDHKPFSKHDQKEIQVPKELNNIEDLIELGKLYHCQKLRTYCGLDLKILCNLVVPLTKLSQMIGMKSFKENLVTQIIFLLQDLDKKEKCNECFNCIAGKFCTAKNDGSMKNICIYGPPGTGKTAVSAILGEIYNNMGIIKGDGYVVAKRDTLISGYLGQTALKTSKFLNETLPKKGPDGKMTGGKIIILDEVYQFGSGVNSHSGGGDRDSFSKECIDTINQFLSENPSVLMICCGYKEDVANCVFSVNSGMERRFPFRYEIEAYNSKELMDIFLLKVKKCNWTMNVNMQELEKFFSDKAGQFPNYGGDIENYLYKCKVVHGYRCVYLEHEKKILTMADITKGFELFIKHKPPNMSNTMDLDYDGIYMMDTD